MEIPMDRPVPVRAPYPGALAERFARLVPATMEPPALFRAVACNEGLFNHLVDSGWLGPTGLLDRRVLPRRLRELLILRTCHANHNDYEWRLHVGTISARMGLGEAEIADTWNTTPDGASWTAAELTAMAMVDSLVRERALPDALYARLREHFDEATLIEMTQLVGLYTGVAMLVALLQPAADAYAAPLPTREKV
jgi:alkylhydroperoxidase family enzyme